MPDTDDVIPGSWAAVDQDSERFRGLLKKYDDDYQKATDAYLRGEEPGPEDKRKAGSENPI